MAAKNGEVTSEQKFDSLVIRLRDGSDNGGYCCPESLEAADAIHNLVTALLAIERTCSAPVNEMAQREAVHFAYNTARAALNKELQR